MKMLSTATGKHQRRAKQTRLLQHTRAVTSSSRIAVNHHRAHHALSRVARETGATSWDETSLQSSCEAKNTTRTQFAGTTTSNTNTTQHTVEGEEGRNIPRRETLATTAKQPKGGTATRPSHRSLPSRDRREPPVESTPTNQPLEHVASQEKARRSLSL
jgi:hypothetical protein